MTLAADTQVAEGRAPVVLVTLWMADRLVWVASRPITIENADTGEVFSYDAGLLGVQDFAEELNLYELTAQGQIQQASLELILPDSAAAAALDDSSWLYMCAAEAELSVIWEGEDWADRRILVARTILGMPELGLADASLRFSLETVNAVDGALVGDPDRDLGVGITPTLGYERLNGRTFPMILGRVYGVPLYKIGVWGSPAPTHARALVCGHRTAPLVTASGVVLYEDGTAYTPAGSISLVQATDDDGGAVALLESTDATDFRYSDHPGSLSVDLPNGAWPSRRSPDRGAQSVGEIVEILLGLSGVRVDWSRSRPALAWLSDWDLGLYVDQPASALSLLRDRILPWIPATLCLSSGGLWIARCMPWQEPPTFELLDGQNCVLDQSVKYTDQTKVKNSFTLRYGYDHSRQDYAKTLTLGGRYPLAELSQRLFGLRQDDELSCNVCWSDATAQKILEARAARSAMPRRTMRGLLEPSLYSLQAGQVGVVSSERLGITQRRCFISRMSPLQQPVPVELELIPETLTSSP